MASGNTTVTRGNENTAALETELHELIALAEEVVGGEGRLFPAVGNGDGVGGLKITARLVGSITIDSRIVTSLTVGGRGAVGSVNGVEELVKETDGSIRGVEVRVGLVELEILRVDNGIGNVEIKSSLTDSFAAIRVLAIEVNEVDLGAGALGDFGGVFGEEEVQVALLVHFAGTLEHAHAVAGVLECSIADVVLVLDALGGDAGGAVGGSLNG